MVDVFISYKRDDRARVDMLAGLLRDLDLKVWHDASLGAGEDWQTRIEQVARAAQSMIVCWTDAAAHSPWVRQEVEIGRARKVLVPVLFELTDLPEDLARLHCADLSDWSDTMDHLGFRQMIQGLDKILGRNLPAHLEERVGGENPAVVSALRRMLVSRARLGKGALSYGEAHSRLSSLWAKGERTPFNALYGALDAIAAQNRARREPPLFALVVGRDGLPGRGYFQKHCFLAGGYSDESKAIHAAHIRRVQTYSWPDDPPEPGELLLMMGGN